MNKNTNKRIRIYLYHLFLVAFLFSCSDGSPGGGKGKRGDASNAKRQEKAIPVEVSVPTFGLAASYYVTTATLEPSSDAKINSRTTGVITKILHEEGDDVTAGEILLVIDDADQQLRLRQASQKLASAGREFKRLSKMKKAGVVSPTEWEAADNTFVTAQTEKELAELALSYTRVAAPFSGRVVWREVDLGAHVSQGELLFRMMAINPLLVRVHIPVNRLGKIAVGQTVHLNLDSVNDILSAQIELISPIVDPSTGTIKITLKLESYPDSVRPGDFAEIHMKTDQHLNALLIDSVAIIEERNQHFVYVIEQGRSRRQPVTIGFVMKGKTEIISGLEKNDQIVVKGQRNLNDDVLVNLLNGVNTSQAKVTNKARNANKAGSKNKSLHGNKKRGQP
jgi:membrane fusion protein, multidrug efflux system